MSGRPYLVLKINGGPDSNGAWVYLKVHTVQRGIELARTFCLETDCYGASLMWSDQRIIAQFYPDRACGFQCHS